MVLWVCRRDNAVIRAGTVACGKEKSMKTITEITSNQQKAEIIRLAAYCRVSSNSEDQLHSFAAQVKHYTEYVAEHPEYELVDIYAPAHAWTSGMISTA